MREIINIKQYLLKKLNKFHQLFVSINLKSCKHGFKASEVVNLKIDPTCVKCGKRLSELENF